MLPLLCVLQMLSKADAVCTGNHSYWPRFEFHYAADSLFEGNSIQWLVTALTLEQRYNKRLPMATLCTEAAAVT